MEVLVRDTNLTLIHLTVKVTGGGGGGLEGQKVSGFHIKDFVERKNMQKPHEKILFLAKVMIFENHDLPVITVSAKT